MTENGRTGIPEGYRDLLESTALVHVATLGPNGEPQNNPVWFGWDGENIQFSQTKTRQKYRNLGREPRLALSIVDPENPYRYLEIRGEVDRIEEDPDNDFINAMAKKYMGRDVYPFHQPGDERVVVHVRPRHTTQMGA
ncbi:TIGR03618 family F420-dependent PPOX class oxidoreductase [Rubrobacter tropicus]|uniref:TIGR03618 family F420-dependent PPOX class oxidoreductase n=1 Tax=Rubrobacter tropicus TaxID=2653851 RepID=A0A6G8Q8C9_9ACTN|nr:PPOX class F420-dependent oxidoreductase [Rubrobacter tropicus]QIN82567.1 TIGR03618 family F420-dependent PPOX class oxidoreductase [Rubrobacter tropicus]